MKRLQRITARPAAALLTLLASLMLLIHAGCGNNNSTPAPTVGDASNQSESALPNSPESEPDTMYFSDADRLQSLPADEFLRSAPKAAPEPLSEGLAAGGRRAGLGDMLGDSGKSEAEFARGNSESTSNFGTALGKEAAATEARFRDGERAAPGAAPALGLEAAAPGERLIPFDAPDSAPDSITAPAPSPAEPALAAHPFDGRNSRADAPADAAPGFPDMELSAGAQLRRSRRVGQSGIRAVELLPGEELWVIARSDDQSARRPANPDVPGCGALLTQLPNETTTVPVPLKHTAVSGSIDGYIATVDVTQQFHNPFSSKIEAVYVFPLPENAAVNEFIMTIGERRIRGIIREREKAEQIYNQARSQGHTASLLTQERPNIFTQKVANIDPGKQIDIQIRYFNTLRYEDGSYEFVFPMVVGPRYNPAGTADGVAAVARNSEGSSQQATSVSYLAPEERSGHDVSVSVSINAGLEIQDVRSINHRVDVTPISECERKVTLSADSTIPNRDFVLRYRVAGDQIRSAMMTHQDQHGKYFTLMVCPPADLKSVERSPMEMVFLLDCSGSMNGQPIQQAKAAIAHALQQLTPRDTFQIIRFSSDSSQLGSDPVVATPANIQKGLAYLQSLNGSGGTEMQAGIRAALEFPHDEGRFRLVSFMTDGFIGNEQQVLETITARLGDSRIFSFGVGQSPNRYLMDRMAVVGRGAVSYLSLNDDAVDVMNRFLERISHPAMTDLFVDFGEMQVTDVYPQRLPDLIVGRPVILTGRFSGEPSAVTVGGRIGMNPTSFEVRVRADESEPSSAPHPGIAAVWARMKIADLMLAGAGSQAAEQHPEARAQVLQTALNYNLMSSFTSFVAVDSLTKTEGSFGTTVVVPVPVPEGVRYDTTVAR